MGEINTVSYSTSEIVALACCECVKVPVTIKSGLDLAKGTVLGRITASGLYGAYNDGNNDGTEVASGVLAYAVDSSSAGLNRDVDAPMYIKGAFVESLLTGIDANGKTDLNGRTVPGRDIFIF